MRNRRGWWKIRDAQGEIKVRAWAQGIWWTPLRDGWISSPPGYEKLKFLCAMEPQGSEMCPVAEMERAAKLFQGKSNG